MTLSLTESVIFYIEKRRQLLYEVSPFGCFELFLAEYLVFRVLNKVVKRRSKQRISL